MTPGIWFYILFYLFSFPIPPYWFGFSLPFMFSGVQLTFILYLLLSSFPWFFRMENTWLIIFTSFKALSFWSSSSISWLLSSLLLLFPKFLLHRGWGFCLFGWLVAYLSFLLQWRRYSFCSADSVWKDYWSLEVSWGLSEKIDLSLQSTSSFILSPGYACALDYQEISLAHSKVAHSPLTPPGVSHIGFGVFWLSFIPLLLLRAACHAYSLKFETC